MVIPIHRDSGVSFEAENGITTWADEIDYGIFEDFGWPGSGYNVDGTYQSLLNAIHNSIEYLYNEIQALKNDGTVSIALTKGQYQGSWNPTIITATVSNGNANETSWRVTQKAGTTAWLTADTLGVISPLGISVNSGNPNLVNTSVNNASAIFIGSYTGIGKEVYNSFPRLIQSISILNNHGTNFTGANDSAIFKVNIDPTVSKTYTAVITATNREATRTMDMTRTVNGLTPSAYQWGIYKNETTTMGRPSISSDGLDATFTSSEYGIQITIKNYKTEQATVICQENNTGSDIEFYVRCRTTYQDPSIVNNTTTDDNMVKCVIKAQAQQTADYWYAGQDHPSENSTIVTDNSSPGWRLTGTTLDADYEFITTDNNIKDNPTRREPWYIALPVNTQYHLYDDVDAVVEEDYASDDTIEFNGITYKVYHLETPARALGGITIKK